jgi:hypothetical protein
MPRTTVLMSPAASPARFIRCSMRCRWDPKAGCRSAQALNIGDFGTRSKAGFRRVYTRGSDTYKEWSVVGEVLENGIVSWKLIVESDNSECALKKSVRAGSDPVREEVINKELEAELV